MEKEKETFFFIFFDKKKKKRKNSNLLIVQTFLILKRDPINCRLCVAAEKCS